MESCPDVVRDGGKEGVLGKEVRENRKLLESDICSKTGTHSAEGMSLLPFTSLWSVPW